MQASAAFRHHGPFEAVSCMCAYKISLFGPASSDPSAPTPYTPTPCIHPLHLPHAPTPYTPPLHPNPTPYPCTHPLHPPLYTLPLQPVPASCACTHPLHSPPAPTPAPTPCIHLGPPSALCLIHATSMCAPTREKGFAEQGVSSSDRALWHALPLHSIVPEAGCIQVYARMPTRILYISGA